MFVMAVCAGIISRGCDVADLGVVATPTAMLAVEKMQAGSLCRDYLKLSAVKL
jgi:phosphomannomutase